MASPIDAASTRQLVFTGDPTTVRPAAHAYLLGKAFGETGCLGTARDPDPGAQGGLQPGDVVQLTIEGQRLKLVVLVGSL